MICFSPDRYALKKITVVTNGKYMPLYTQYCIIISSKYEIEVMVAKNLLTLSSQPNSAWNAENTLILFKQRSTWKF